MSTITTSQTIGPFSHEAWQWAVDGSSPARLVTSTPTVTVSGAIYDGNGTPIDDAQIEAWTPDSAQAESGQQIPGFRRVPSGSAGEFTMRLSLPDDGMRGEPLMYVTIFARGLLKHQFTAVFREDDKSLAQSAILAQVPEARRPTLLARKTGDGHYRWDIRMQGDRETAFFDYA